MLRASFYFGPQSDNFRPRLDEKLYGRAFQPENPQVELDFSFHKFGRAVVFSVNPTET